MLNDSKNIKSTRNVKVSSSWKKYISFFCFTLSSSSGLEAFESVGWPVRRLQVIPEVEDPKNLSGKDDVDYSMIDISTVSSSRVTPNVNYSLVNTSTAITWEQNVNTTGASMQEIVVHQRLPEIKMYLEVDYLASTPNERELASFFKSLIEELLDMGSIDRRFALLPSDISSPTVALVPLTLFPSTLLSSGAVPVEVTVNTYVTLLQRNDIDYSSLTPEARAHNIQQEALLFAEQAEEDLSYSFSVYLTLWDCTAILEAFEKDCGLKSPRLVAIHVGFTEIAGTDHHYVVVRSELQEETTTSSGEASVRLHGWWTLIAAAIFLMLFLTQGLR